MKACSLSELLREPLGKAVVVSLAGQEPKGGTGTISYSFLGKVSTVCTEAASKVISLFKQEAESLAKEVHQFLMTSKKSGVKIAVSFSSASNILYRLGGIDEMTAFMLCSILYSFPII